MSTRVHSVPHPTRKSSILNICRFRNILTPAVIYIPREDFLFPRNGDAPGTCRGLVISAVRRNKSGAGRAIPLLFVSRVAVRLAPRDLRGSNYRHSVVSP